MGKSGDDVCSGTMNNLVACLVINTSKDARCLDCIENGLKNDVTWNDGCLEAENGICQVIRSGCHSACDGCSEIVEEYTRCLFDYHQPQCDDLQCDAIFTKHKYHHIAWVSFLILYIPLRIWCKHAATAHAEDDNQGTELSAASNREVV